MTRKERAIRNLKQMCSNGRYLGSGSYVPLEVLEDFEVAIKALEQKPTTKENLAVAELGEDLRKTRTAICNKKVLIGFNLAVAVMNKHLGGKK